MSTNSDDIRAYNSGATDIDQPQDDSSKSLGGWSSSTFVHSLAHSLVGAIRDIRVDFISAGCGTGSHALVATTEDSLQFGAADDDLGLEATILEGETKVLYSDDIDKYVIVTRATDDPLLGACTINTAYLHNNCIGFDDALITDSDDYRLVIFKNNSSLDYLNVQVWVDDTSTGISIALDSPDETGIYRELSIDGETATPTGSLSFSSPTTQETALTFNILSGETVGLWLKREIPDTGTSLGISQQINFGYGYGYVNNYGYSNFSYGYNTMHAYGYGSLNQLIGKYRLGDLSLEKWELYRGLDGGEMDFFMAASNIYGFPWESDELDPGHTHQFVLRYRNRYDLLSQNIEQYIVPLDAFGAIELEDPSAPDEIAIIPIAGSKFIISAVYYYLDDDEDARADEWSIYLHADGDVDLDNDEPEIVDMVLTEGQARLLFVTDSYSADTVLHAVVRGRRSNDEVESTNTEEVTAESIGELDEVTPACGYVVKATNPNLIKIWEHSADIYIQVDTKREVMRFVIGGNIVAGLARSGTLHLDGFVVEESLGTVPLASYITYAAGSIEFGAGSPVYKLAAISSTGDLHVYHAEETEDLPAEDWESGDYYQGSATDLKFSVDLSRTCLTFSKVDLVPNGEVRTRRIRTGY